MAKETVSKMVDWKHLEGKIKEAAAKGEPQWIGLGEREELKIWRIEQFRAVPWPKVKHGTFHVGDSYLICNSYKANPNEATLQHDLHVWIGDKSTQDEYGTAAYKMVEADDKLGGKAVQHREVQFKESKKFLDLFSSRLTYLEGGVASGFRHVEPSIEEPHLYCVKGSRKALVLLQLRVRRDEMNCGDCFILHAGEKVWIWIGNEANPEEKVKAMEVARAFTTESNVKVFDQGVNDGEVEAADFWKYMPSSVSTMGILRKSMKIKEADDKDFDVNGFTPVLYRIPQFGCGKMKRVSTAKLVKVEGSVGKATPRIKRNKLDGQHAFLLDTGFHVYIWLGQDVDASTRVAVMPFSNYYFKKYNRPMMAVTLVKENQEIHAFDNLFYGPREKSSCTCSLM